MLNKCVFLYIFVLVSDKPA